MFTHAGLTYTGLSSTPTFEQACEEAREGRVLAQGDFSDRSAWTIPARKLILAWMHKWMPVAPLNPAALGTFYFSAESEDTLLKCVKKLLLDGTRLRSPGLSFSEIVGRCINNIDEHRPTLNDQTVRIRHAVCYLVHGLATDTNRQAEINSHIQQLIDREPLPAMIQCVDCSNTYTGIPPLIGENRWIRFGENQMRNSNGRHFVCNDCHVDHWRFSPYENRHINTEDEATISADFLEEGTTVSETYARAHFHVWEDEDGEEQWSRTRPPAERLLNYSANPFDYNKWDDRNATNALVFGVELEMEAQRDRDEGVARLISLLGGSCKPQAGYILKSDGSLHHGVELVTMPFSLEQHKDGKTLPWEKILAKVNRGEAMSGARTERCGMHIHINKACLSAFTIGKMLVFINSEKLSSLISTIAQRGSGHYCERDSKKVTDGSRNSSNRYDILNVSESHPTCEVRMFRGNLRPERVFKNLEFCHAMVQYCRQTSLQDLEDWGNFSRWLISKRGVYPHLVQFLIEKQALGFRQLAQEDNEHFTRKVVEEV